MILAGDIGGTSTRLAFFELVGRRLRVVAEQTYTSSAHSGLREIVKRFVAAHKLPVDCACFGIAGHVKRDRVETTNLAWIIDSENLANDLGLETVGLINDLEANAHGIAELETKDLVVVNEGASDVVGNAAVISAGTGLGEAGMYWDGRDHHPFASEGGHADFAPRNELETELLRYLLGKFERVSYERVLSGPGLYNIYQFLRDTGRGQECVWMVGEIEQRGYSAAISQAALEGRCELSVMALDLFVSLYGAEAGNLALKIMATGGVYVGGGIAPQIIDKLRAPEFRRAFTAKGRLRPLLEAIPVRVILNDKTALLGAARYALRCAKLTELSFSLRGETK